MERPGLLLVIAFVAAQLIATFLAVYARWGFANIKGIGWKWAGIIWLYSLVTYVPLDVLKFSIRYFLRGNPWNVLIEKTAFTSKREYGKEEREVQWARSKSTKLNGSDTKFMLERTQCTGVSKIVEKAMWRADIMRLQEPSSSVGQAEPAIWKHPAEPMETLIE